MLLRAVELHNFRGYRNFKLKFAPLTSLLGEGEVGKKTHIFAPYEDVKQYMYNLIQKRHQSWSKDKPASKLMKQMDLADLQDYYEKDGQKHRELVEYFLQIDRFIDSLA